MAPQAPASTPVESITACLVFLMQKHGIAELVITETELQEAHKALVPAVTMKIDEEAETLTLKLGTPAGQVLN